MVYISINAIIICGQDIRTDNPSLAAVGVRQGKGECIVVLNIHPPPDLDFNLHSSNK